MLAGGTQRLLYTHKAQPRPALRELHQMGGNEPLHEVTLRKVIASVPRWVHAGEVCAVIFSYYQAGAWQQNKLAVIHLMAEPFRGSSACSLTICNQQKLNPASSFSLPCTCCTAGSRNSSQLKASARACTNAASAQDTFSSFLTFLKCSFLLSSHKHSWFLSSLLFTQCSSYRNTSL